MSLVADHLVVYKNSIFDEIASATLNTFVVVTNSAERSDLLLVGNDVHKFASEVEFLRLPFIEREETGTCEVGFVSQHAIEFRRVTNRFVYGEPEVRWIENKIIFARLHCFRFQFFDSLC